MALSTAWENALMQLVYNNVAAANIGTAAGLQPSSDAGCLYVALHSADPTSGGNQASNEISYTGYTRAGLPRDAAHWTVSGNQASNTGAVVFGQCTGGAATATHVSIGTAASGAGQILWSGALAASLAISNGITPQFAAGQLATTVS